MKTLYFRCELLSDVILNQRAATQGNQRSLDFIPGNNFLGIAAAQIYKDNTLSNEDKSTLFHGGKIRFGDAHPEKYGRRSLKIPASMYKSKTDDKFENGLYIHHNVPDFHEEKYRKFQAEQCREGFYLFDERMQIIKTDVNKSFAIKSAYDRKKRRAADEKMYGYESLETGSFWIFEVSLNEDISERFEEMIRQALIGTKHIGRSKTAQYGFIKIEEIEAYPEIIFDEFDPDSEYVLLYADARLIFFDEYGIPTFQPTAEDLGFLNGEVDWNKSQIRTFQYAPWNVKRQTRDADRCGIEKGSVFYIKRKNPSEKLEISELRNPDDSVFFVGVYQNEGFGKVLLNPEFLQTNSIGKAVYSVLDEREGGPQTQINEKNETKIENSLLTHLRGKKEREDTERKAYKKVNEFIKKNAERFSKERFASQWGTIRSIAIQKQTKQELEDALFKQGSGYLTHGIAAEKWKENKRFNVFKDFFEDLDEQSAIQTIINLAAEMAKVSAEGNND